MGELRDRVDDILRDRMKPNPAIERAWRMGEAAIPPPDDMDRVPPEAFLTIWKAVEGLRAAVLQLADEIDAVNR